MARVPSSAWAWVKSSMRSRFIPTVRALSRSGRSSVTSSTRSAGRLRVTPLHPSRLMSSPPHRRARVPPTRRYELERQRSASTRRPWRPLALAEAERVAGRVEEDPERGARLVVGLGGAHGQHPALTVAEIGDVEVEVELLGHVLARPGRSAVVLGLLERERPPTAGVELRPRVVRPVGDGPA